MCVRKHFFLHPLSYKVSLLVFLNRVTEPFFVSLPLLSPSFYFNPVPPECEMRLLPKEMDGLSRIQCTATSNPPVLTFNWSKNNKSIKSENVIQQQKSTTSSILLLENGGVLDLESYSCTATNMMGTSNPCKLEALTTRGNKKLLF